MSSGFMDKKVTGFPSSHSNSSFESESPRTANDAVHFHHHSPGYAMFKDDLYSEPIPPLPSSRDGTGKDSGASYCAVLVSMIDRKMKEHSRNVLRAAHGISAQISELEGRTRQLEDLIDDLKNSTDYYHGRTERRLTQVENTMTEVQDGIQDLRDKQEIAEAQLQLQLAKLQLLRAGSQSKHQCSNVQIKSVQQQGPTVHRQGDQQYPTPASGQLQLPDLSCNVTPNTHHDKLLQVPADTAAQLPRQLNQNQYRFVQHPIHRPSLLSPDSTNMQYHTFPIKSPAAPYQPYIHSSVSQSYLLSQTPLNTLRPSSHQANQYHLDETYMPFKEPHPLIPKLPHTPGAVSSSQQLYYHNLNNQPMGSLSSKPSVEHSKPFGNVSTTDRVGGLPFHYWNPETEVSQSLPLPLVPGGNFSNQQSQAARALPHAIPMASSVNDAEGSGGTESSISTEDIVEKVVAMGFRRDIVRATVRKLSENEQSVDLNMVLDKLFNSAETR